MNALYGLSDSIGDIYATCVREITHTKIYCEKNWTGLYIVLGEISSYPGLVTLKNNPVSENMELKMT